MDVGDFVSELIPDLRDRIAIILVLDDSTNHRPAASGLRFNALELAELLAGAFDGVGDLVGDLRRAGSGVRRDDERLLNGELGILEPADILIGPYPPYDNQKHAEKDNPVILD